MNCKNNLDTQGILQHSVPFEDYFYTAITNLG